MGNTFANKPNSYSDQTKFGDTQTFGNQVGGSYMAAYRQNSASADSTSYGNTRLQFGAKIVQDSDPGPNQGQLYVVNNAGKRLYITHEGKIAPYASQYVQQAKNYGNGPAVSITGSPLNPKYTMFYAQGGDMHKGDGWTPITINSKQDIQEAMQSGMGGLNISSGKYSNMYGQASINPFGAKEGGDMWTAGANFDRAITGVVSQLVLPVAESFLDDVVPFASTILGVTGANKAMQSGLDSLVKHSNGKMYQSTTHFDPNISNMIKDPRLPAYLSQVQDKSHTYIAKYGAQDYAQTQKLAQDTPQQQLMKARQLSEENQNLYVQQQVQEMTDTSTKLQQLVGSKADPQIFQDIKTGLATAQTNQQKLNVINHFGKQLQSQVLPLLDNQSPAAAPGTGSAVSDPQKDPTVTASAQPGHPILSINGNFTTDPRKTTISGDSQTPQPMAT
jgi:hypothetical protein